MESSIKVGISSCLLGNKVRYDGSHKLDRYITDTLGQYLEFVAVCPEAECGLGIPREPMRLVGPSQSPRLVTVRTQVDHTERMNHWARQRVIQLEQEGLCGFIFKSGSPSSGMERVKVYGERGIPQKHGVGLFARAFMEHFPLLPVEDEGRLHDSKLRENFVESLFVMKRWRELLLQGANPGKVVAFHTRHKLLMLSHSPRHYQALGKLVAQGKTMPQEGLLAGYQTLLLEGLQLKPTSKKNTNVLQHLLGYFKKQLAADEKQELLEIIETYRSGHIPLIVPITLVNHYVRKYHQPYLNEQYYLHPHPVELQLRNHV
jgi:uncharacterized protein YbgA (DUF1722 family)/uncharacterized protein YbbK (DUF523 family)